MNTNLLNQPSTNVNNNNKIRNDILELIGKTPLVRLNKIPALYGIECEIYVKCEFLNPGGSMEDRVAKNFVENAERNGHLKKGKTTLIRKMDRWEEGIGLEFVAARKGFPLINILTTTNADSSNSIGENENQSSVSTLKSLGGRIIYAKNNSTADEEKKLYQEIGNDALFMAKGEKDFDEAYFNSTKEIVNEILEVLQEKIDILVGAMRFMENEKIRQILPANCEWINISLDNFLLEKGLKMAKEIHKNEGILCGPNSGQILLATIQAAKKAEGANKKCVVAILPDGIRHMLPKFDSDTKFKQALISNDALFPIEIDETDYCPTKQPTLNFQKVSNPWANIAKCQKRSPLQHSLMENISEAIGHIPMLRLNKLPKMHGIEAEIVVKCEFMNSGGSIKDRAAKKMIEMAELSRELRPGMIIIEPSSGNTGIAMAMMAASKGYRCIIVMPEKMSKEKEITIRSLGADLIRVPSSPHSQMLPYITTDHNPKSDIFLAQTLQRQIPNSIVLDQYRNQWNPFAHYETTGQEILEACEGKLDAIVIGCGTGGTLTGVGRKIKECIPQCKIFGVDPFGSTISAGGGPENAHSYEVEGIGYDFIPAVLDYNLVDEWIKTDDVHSFAIAHALIREEGILCGGSSGANVWAAMEVAKKLGRGKRVVTILPDGIRNYL